MHAATTPNSTPVSGTGWARSSHSGARTTQTGRSLVESPKCRVYGRAGRDLSQGRQLVCAAAFTCPRPQQSPGATYRSVAKRRGEMVRALASRSEQSRAQTELCAAARLIESLGARPPASYREDHLPPRGRRCGHFGSPIDAAVGSIGGAGTGLVGRKDVTAWRGAGLPCEPAGGGADHRAA